MDRNIENSLRQVRDRIKGRKALCAAASLRSLLTSHPRFTALLPELDRVVESYNYMAAFMFRGTPDQGRERFFRDTLEALSTLTRRAERLARGADAPGLYYAEMRTQSYVQAEMIGEKITQRQTLKSKFFFKVAVFQIRTGLKMNLQAANRNSPHGFQSYFYIV